MSWSFTLSLPSSFFPSSSSSYSHCSHGLLLYGSWCTPNISWVFIFIIIILSSFVVAVTSTFLDGDVDEVTGGQLSKLYIQPTFFFLFFIFTQFFSADLLPSLINLHWSIGQQISKNCYQFYIAYWFNWFVQSPAYTLMCFGPYTKVRQTTYIHTYIHKCFVYRWRYMYIFFLVSFYVPTYLTIFMRTIIFTVSLFSQFIGCPLIRA